MRFTYPCLALALTLAACGPGKGTTDTTTTASTGPEPSTSSGSSSPTEPATTGDPETTASSTATSTSGDPSVATSIASSETTAITDPVTTTATTSTTSTTTGEPGEPECEVDADCKLHADCCTCEGVPVGVDPEVCDGECDQSRCDELGIDAAVCRIGVCETERLSCDASQVICDAPTPDCPPGERPETTPTCWTGRCVPAAICDFVEDCGQCPADMMCVTNFGRGASGTRCEPIPPGCGGVPGCDCVADLVCLDPFNACFAMGPIISCECPNC